MRFIAHFYIYIHLYIVHWKFWHSRLPTRHQMLSAFHQIIPPRHWMIPAPQRILVYFSSYNIYQCFFISRSLMFYAWSHSCEHMYSQLCTICTIWLSLQVFYEGRLFTTCWVHTVVSSPIFLANWNVSVQHTPLFSRRCLDLFVKRLICTFMHSISINSLSISQCCLVTFCTIPNGILLQFFTLGAGLSLRQLRGVRFLHPLS